MVVYQARTLKNAKMRAKEARKIGLEATVFRKRKGLTYGISVTRK